MSIDTKDLRLCLSNLKSEVEHMKRTTADLETAILALNGTHSDVATYFSRVRQDADDVEIASEKLDNAICDVVYEIERSEEKAAS